MKDVIYLVTVDYEVQAAFYSFQNAASFLQELSPYTLDFSKWKSDLLIPYVEPVNGWKKYSDFIITELEIY